MGNCESDTRQVAPKHIVKLSILAFAPPLPNLLQAYHTAVVVDTTEYTFCHSGLIEHQHRRSSATVVDVGQTTISGDAMVKALLPFFKPGTYDLLRKNCNSFSDCALYYLVGIRLDDKYKSLEKMAASADQRMGLVRVLSLGDYAPNPRASGFHLGEILQWIGQNRKTRSRRRPRAGLTRSQSAPALRSSSGPPSAATGMEACCMEVFYDPCSGKPKALMPLADVPRWDSHPPPAEKGAGEVSCDGAC